METSNEILHMQLIGNIKMGDGVSKLHLEWQQVPFNVLGNEVSYR